MISLSAASSRFPSKDSRIRGSMALGTTANYGVNPTSKQNGTLDSSNSSEVDMAQGLHKAALYVLGEKSQVKVCRLTLTMCYDRLIPAHSCPLLFHSNLSCMYHYLL